MRQNVVSTTRYFQNIQAHTDIHTTTNSSGFLWKKKWSHGEMQLCGVMVNLAMLCKKPLLLLIHNCCPIKILIISVLWVLLLSCIFVCVLTLLAKSAHPSLWTGASVWSLAHTSVLTLEPTDGCTNKQNMIGAVMMTQSQQNSSTIAVVTKYQNTTQRHAAFRDELDVRC